MPSGGVAQLVEQRTHKPRVPRSIRGTATKDVNGLQEFRGVKPPDDSAAVHIRGIPRDTCFRLKMAAAAEKKTVRELLLKLIEDKIQELEKKGLLPKGK
jgi:hypothetical protein